MLFSKTTVKTLCGCADRLVSSNSRGVVYFACLSGRSYRPPGERSVSSAGSFPTEFKLCVDVTDLVTTLYSAASLAVLAVDSVCVQSYEPVFLPVIRGFLFRTAGKEL